MNEKPENPPAFACAAENGHQEGMTLRDYFAATALQGLISRRSQVGGDGDEGKSIAQVYADQSYFLADAMLKARAA